MKIYKVYDDEWEELFGPNQLIDFCRGQMADLLGNYTFAEIDDDIDFYIKAESRVKIKNLLREFDRNSDALNNISEELAIELLQLRFYMVKEIELY